jgi:hypothetical protein
VSKSFKNYNEEIDAIKREINELQVRLEEIRKIQLDLDYTQEESPALDKCRKDIKPFDEFWKTYAEIEEKQEYWLTTNVNELDPEEVESKFKKL